MNDKGCLYCLPSIVAPILYGLFNLVNVIYWLFADQPVFYLIAGIFLVPLLPCLIWRTSACARGLAMLAFVIESALLLFFIYAMNEAGNSE